MQTFPDAKYLRQTTALVIETVCFTMFEALSISSRVLTHTQCFQHLLHLTRREDCRFLVA